MPPRLSPAELEQLFPGDGEMATLIRTTDWSKLPPGPIESWPQTLRMAVSLCLGTRHPIVLWWGPERWAFYNDAHRPMLGESKHPQFLGRPVEECWPEIMPIVGPMMDQVMETGEATWSEDLFLLMHRYGYLEETYFTFSYSPIRDETGTPRGIFNCCTETTARVLGERRLKTLREMAVEARTADEAAQQCAQVLARNSRDIPFALVYLLDDAGRRLHLAGQTGLEPGTSASPLVVELDHHDPGWPFARVVATGRSELVQNLTGRFDCLPTQPWDEPADQALVLPIARPGRRQPAGVLVLGISPRRAFDDHYRGFFELVAGHVATAMANARAYEEEKKRAEALAELDRAKTAFFSNVSHEFRTPLTLMLGPLEELLTQPEGALPPEDHDRLQLVHRNGLRLLKLVNTLLDFSRIEAGRAQATYEPVDLAALTVELASLFRSAIERAGLRLEVDCPSLPEPVYVDREMWEKIVLNLLSNAFKFTLEGEIAVTLRWTGEHVELAVQDTGTGIPEAELPHVFERFHRVKGAIGRSYEGSGIGLALVQELVRLHGGTIQVESRAGAGTEFTVQIPTGTAHLPAERVNAPRDLASTAVRAEAFVEEALRWLPEGGGAAGAGPPPAGQPPLLETGLSAAQRDTTTERLPCVLLADDNADMRDYVRHLLSGRYEVVAVADGWAALAAIQKRLPDLVLSDVMMPNLDGFGLLSELRDDPRTRTLPVILLSARAGEESRLEGLAAGADDYLVKPFTARELLARVEATLKLARLRQEIEHAAGREEALREADRRKEAFLAMLAHELRNPLAPLRNALEIWRRAGDAETLGRLRTMMERQIGHLARLVDDLLNVSRITRGKISLQRERLDLGRLLPEIMDDYRAGAEAAGITLRLDVPETPVWMSGDAVRLTQIVGNLVENALKFTERGGEVAVRLRADADAGQAIMIVQDTGIGIEPEMLPQLFESFSQADRSLDRSRGGLGLGLVLVKGLVELHDGTVVAESAGLGHGTTFTLRFPLLPELPAVAEQPIAGEWPQKRQRILVVEDNWDAADSLRTLLELVGYEVIVEHTGPAGVEAARLVRPDIVLCDIGLPGMDGFAVATRLRGDQATATTRLIAVTGYGEAEARERARRAGFDDHLTKPVDPNTLLERLEATPTAR